MSLPIAVDKVAIVTLKLPEIDAVAAYLSANVPLLRGTASALPAFLDLAVRTATITVLEILVIAFVGSEVQTVTTDLLADSRLSACADPAALNATLVRATNILSY